MPTRNDDDPPAENQQPMPMILPGSASGPTVEQPAKLIRIASMIRELLEDVRQSKPDEAGRKRLREVYERALTALKEGVSKELQDELETLTLPLENTPSESEVRLAQAQLLGWLEGLFQGIQAVALHLVGERHLAVEGALDAWLEDEGPATARALEALLAGELVQGASDGRDHDLLLDIPIVSVLPKPPSSVSRLG